MMLYAREVSQTEASSSRKREDKMVTILGFPGLFRPCRLLTHKARSFESPRPKM